MALELDSDRALVVEECDQFGFSKIAKRLAPSILEASKGAGLVIGLEGPWGSGKTSLLNFLRTELEKGKEANIHTVTIAPWLNGDSTPMVSSLLDPISEMLAKREEELAAEQGYTTEAVQAKVKEVGEAVRAYSQSTARKLVPFASFAGHFFPSGHLAADGLSAAASILESYAPQSQTPSELKAEIAEKIQELGIGFVVILDDLDRLEPAQAVEVVRLVRSVADFPNVAYLMCYDRDVLGQALKTGLNVKDGDLFLQKIVQLTFAIPLPEPFDLRAQFLTGAETLFEQVTGSKPQGDMLQDLRSAVDHEGMGLSTPREVKLALNGIRFVFPSIADDVYFPDFCRLHLIKTTQFKLYKWLEKYLSVRSIIVTGDGRINAENRKDFGKKLKKLLPSEEIDSSKSIWHLSEFVPGIEMHEEPKKRVFAKTSRQDVSGAIRLKRLGSPIHYRYYFALTSPKTVMNDADFHELLQLAGKDLPELTAKLLTYASEIRPVGKSWLEHVLNRLDEETIATLEDQNAAGFIHSICDCMDTAISNQLKPGSLVFGIEKVAAEATEALFVRLRDQNPSLMHKVAKDVAKNAKALNWLVGRLFRDQIWDHGIVGDRKTQPEQWVFDDVFLNELMAILDERLKEAKTQDSFQSMPDLSGFLYGWRDLSGAEVVRKWVKEFSVLDENFLQVLESLRHWAMSNTVYYPLSEQSVSDFFDLGEAKKRLDEMEGGHFSEKARELKQAINQASD